VEVLGGGGAAQGGAVQRLRAGGVRGAVCQHLLNVGQLLPQVGHLRLQTTTLTRWPTRSLPRAGYQTHQCLLTCRQPACSPHHASMHHAPRAPAPAPCIHAPHAASRCAAPGAAPDADCWVGCDTAKCQLMRRVPWCCRPAAGTHTPSTCPRTQRTGRTIGS
jgi:hypothetical protein